MSDKLKKIFLESIIVLSVLGVVTSLIFRITKPKISEDYFAQINGQYPLLGPIIYLLIFSIAAVYNYREIFVDKRDTKPSYRSYYLLVLFTGGALYFLFELFEKLSS